MYHKLMLRGLLVLACASVGIAGITADPYALGTPGPVPYPKSNPYTAAKAELGRRLFEERALSNTRQTPCTWCHNEGAGFSDGRTVNIGDTKEALNRHSPTLIGSGYQPQLFWDGRVKTLEEQVLMPIEHPMEMNLSLKAVPERLKKAKYEPLFEQAFGTQEITKERVAMALATYVRTLTDNETPFDKFVKGDKQALSPIARQGLAVFKGKGQCTTCHSGPHFTRATIPGADPFAKTGLAQSYVIGEDHGRGDLTKNPKDNGFWRIPSLRGIGRTAPYMHNGTLESLEDVVEFYDRGGDEGALPKLKLTKQEKAALVEFLQDGLTGG